MNPVTLNPGAPPLIDSNSAFEIGLDGNFANLSTAALLTHAFETLQPEIIAGNKSGLAIFFNGGLTELPDALSGAAYLLNPTGDPSDGYLATTAYPFFCAWDTGAGSVLAANWLQVLTSTIFTSIFGHVLNAVTPDDGNRNAIHAMLTIPNGDVTVPTPIKTSFTPAEIVALQRAIDNDPVIAHTLAAAHPKNAPSAEHAEALKALDFVGPNAKAALLPDGGGIGIGISALFDVANIIRRILQRYATGRAHPGLMTITEEVARPFLIGPLLQDVWAKMKQTAANSFTAGGAGTALIKALAGLLRAKHEARITLIGHSEGSNYINALLPALVQELSADNFAWAVDVIFMAGSVRYDAFNTTLTDCSKHIGAMRSFQLGPDYEATDSILKYIPDVVPPPPIIAIYPGSIMYLICGLLEDDDDADLGDVPLVGMQRYSAATFAPMPDVKGVSDFLGTQSHGTVISTATSTLPINGYQSTAEQHGTFPRDLATLQSTDYILDKGFD
jgi:hypothetical protein